jgi:putative lipase involved disintegration of autophagic bodies
LGSRNNNKNGNGTDGKTKDKYMATKQVTCINKPNHQSAHEHITHIGNLAERWRVTRETAVYEIENNVNSYYTVDRATGKVCLVGVVRESGKASYLRTHADGKYNDNLLAQPECGDNCRIG